MKGSYIEKKEFWIWVSESMISIHIYQWRLKFGPFPMEGRGVPIKRNSEIWLFFSKELGISKYILADFLKQKYCRTQKFLFWRISWNNWSGNHKSYTLGTPYGRKIYNFVSPGSLDFCYLLSAHYIFSLIYCIAFGIYCR